MRYCTQCGAQLADESKFCTNCGARIDADEPVQESRSFDRIPVAPIQPENSQEKPWEGWEQPKQQTYQSYNSSPNADNQPKTGYVAGANNGNNGGNKTGLIIGLVVALVVAIVVIAVILLGGNDSEPEVTVPTSASNFQFDIPEAPVAAAEESPVGYWELVEIESSDPDEAVSREDIQMLRDLGIVMFLEFNEDGTGLANTGEEMEFTWEDGVIRSNGVPNDYEIIDGELAMYEGDTTIWFVRADRTETTQPETTVTGSDLTACNGDWYGWWIIDEVTSGAQNMEGQWWEEGNWWDCCAEVDIDADGTGSVLFWDEDLPKNDALADVDFTVTVADDGSLEFVADGGWFMDDGMKYAGMVGANTDSDYDDVLWFAGEYAMSDGTFEYYIFLRPWGHDWQDVQDTDPGLLPYYTDWYFDLIDSGVTKAPNDIGE